MKPYFEKMQEFGKPVKENPANAEQIKKVEQEIAELVEKKKNAGLPKEVLAKRGEWTVHQRLEYIVDPGTWAPLHILYDPMEEESGTTGVVDGLGRINGRWCVIIGFDNKVMAGRVDRGPGGQHPPSHRHRQEAPLPARLARQLQRREAAGAGESVCEPKGQRHHVLQARRA